MSATAVYSFTRPEVDRRFDLLAAELSKHPLPTEAGGTRTATADEFMLMHEEPGSMSGETVTAFKHRDTRNYIFLLRLTNGGAVPAYHALHVPATDKPFMRGFFDVFEFTPTA